MRNSIQGYRSGKLRGVKKTVQWISTVLLVSIAVTWAQTWIVKSPDSTLKIEVKQDIIASVASGQKNCYFRVLVGSDAVVDWSPLGVTASDLSYVSDLSFKTETRDTVDETYTLPTGKRSIYHNHCNEMVLTFANAGNNQIAMYFRAYNDAAAFRYELLGSGSIQVTGEVSGFTIPSGSTGWGHLLPNDERAYDPFTVGASAVTFGIPVLFKTASNAWALITEASVYGDYTGTCYSSKAASKNVFQTTYPIGQGSISGTLPWKLPWRVAVVGKSLGPIVETSVVEHLNPPCEITDTSWIKPGRSAWSWLSQETGDINQQKRYIDFASQMGWEFNLIDWNYDKSKLTETCQYGDQHNVKNELWYNYTDVKSQEQQSSAFSQSHNSGIKSLKIDFIFDNQNENTSYNHSAMQWYDMTTKNLITNKLMVTFHGCTVPRGQRRRWPNIMTYEAVYGYEWVGRGYFPDRGTKHNCTLPFTRNVIGPMDHTPVLFTLGQLTNGSGSSRMSTDAHELALSVIYESGIQHFADRPEGYNSCIGKDFLKIVPNTWDDIHFIDGTPGENAIFARRKGNDWYIAGISALNAKTMTVDLSFLKSGSYTVDLYKDSTAGTKYTMTKQTISINSSTPLSVWVNNNGGFCFKVPNSYQKAVGIQRRDNIASQKSSSNYMTKNGQYRFVYDGSENRHMLIGSGRVINILGKTMVASEDATKLPVGVYVKIEARGR
jgi:alpha-glucosidase